MEAKAHFLVTLGCVLLPGLLTGASGKGTFLPKLTLLLLLGVIIGNFRFDIMPVIFSNRFQLITN